MNLIRFMLALLVVVPTAGCSKTYLWCSGGGVIDGLAPVADRTLAWRTVAALRSGNLAPVKAAFDPGVYAHSLHMMPAVALAIPRTATPGTPYLARIGGSKATEGGKEAVYRDLDYQFGCGDDRVVVRIRILESDGARQVTDWHVDQFVSGRARMSISPKELVTAG